MAEHFMCLIAASRRRDEKMTAALLSRGEGEGVMHAAVHAYSEKKQRTPRTHIFYKSFWVSQNCFPSPERGWNRFALKLCYCMLSIN